MLVSRTRVSTSMFAFDALLPADAEQMPREGTPRHPTYLIGPQGTSQSVDPLRSTCPRDELAEVRTYRRRRWAARRMSRAVMAISGSASAAKSKDAGDETEWACLAGRFAPTNGARALAWSDANA